MYLFFLNISNVDQIELRKKVPEEGRADVYEKTYKGTYTMYIDVNYTFMTHNLVNYFHIIFTH